MSVRSTPSRGGHTLSVPDRALYALFARHADARRHVGDRRHYRGTDMRVSFDVFLARVYGVSWLLGAALAAPTFLVLTALDANAVDAIAGVVEAATPFLAVGALPVLSRASLAVGVAFVVGAGGKHATVRLGGLYLRWTAAARRSGIERTLPGAVRYLHALSSGSDSQRAMLRKVADGDAYGETAVSIRKALNRAALTGSVEEGLRRVARDTPSRDLLAPFLLKFREHASQGSDSLSNYLRMESRMLGHRRERARQRATGFLELVAELFIVLLVMPTLLVIVLTVMSVLAPGLSQPVSTPLGGVSTRALVVYGSAAFILVVGLAASALVSSLRPPGQTNGYRLPSNPLELLAASGRNPAAAAVVAVVPAGVAAALLWRSGVHPLNVGLLGYVAYALPVGAVAVRRAKLDDAKDREIQEFVHAVSGHVSLGRPFPEAVELVARDVDLGALDPDVADLAFNLSLTTNAVSDEGLRPAALDRFVERVGTPLAAQTMGLVTGALDAGSDAEAVFDTLQTEIGRLYHDKQALRSNMLVYVAVGWTTALLVAGIAVAVNSYVLDGFAQLSTLSGGTGATLDPDAVQPARDRFRFYAVTQATMLASGWFAGTASRSWYEALLHSGSLVAVCYGIFAGAGMI
ncbi:type II secretion system F family protein [Haloprofundus salinisoli]|uniref:type II secretion system F family protein n=1 Tax=Haloprofundus salinisoli TaxID=2876193 RepID=UPI001CCB3A63|nr:type II secretion system F family protein [Haloprofundus salinisoli]